MPRRSNEFQRLIFLINQQVAGGASVTESKMLVDRITGAEREVDICIEQQVAGHNIMVSVECRDHKRRAGVAWVETMKAKHERLATNALVLVSRAGFTKEARNLAERYGIRLLAFDEVSKETVGNLFGELSSVWSRSFTLSTSKATMRVEQIDELPAENVIVSSDNIIFSEEGKEISTAREQIENLLKSPEVGNEILTQGREDHKWFDITLVNPSDSRGRPIYLQMLDPLILRRVEAIRVVGRITPYISEFQLKHAVLGEVRVSWGVGEFIGESVLLVASEDQAGEKRVSISVKTRKLRPKP